MKTTGSKRIAERYVRALFDVAESAGALPQVEKDLSALGLALVESEEFRQFLTNPLMSRDQHAAVVKALASKMKAHKITGQFLVMLAAQKRLPILPAIITLFIELTSRSRGELNATLVAAAPLKAKETAAVAERLSKAYGKKVNLDTKQNPELLGGMLLQIGSLQLDGSLVGKINRLKNKLKAA